MLGDINVIMGIRRPRGKQPAKKHSEYDACPFHSCIIARNEETVGRLVEIWVLKLYT